MPGHSYLKLALLVCVLPTTTIAAASDAPQQRQIQRGKYLVKIAGCNDCHTSGYAMSGGKVAEAQWLTGDKLGWRGPWGTTYPSNLRLYFATTSETQWVKHAKSMQMHRDAVVCVARHDRVGPESDLPLRQGARAVPVSRRRVRGPGKQVPRTRMCSFRSPRSMRTLRKGICAPSSAARPFHWQDGLSRSDSVKLIGRLILSGSKWAQSSRRKRGPVKPDRNGSLMKSVSSEPDDRRLPRGFNLPDRHQVSVIARVEHLRAIQTARVALITERARRSPRRTYARRRTTTAGRHDVVIPRESQSGEAIVEDIRALFHDESALVTMQNGIPWCCPRIDGAHGGRHVEAVDPDGAN